MTLTFWKFKGIHLCTYVFPPPHQTLAIKNILHLEMHTSSEDAWGTVHLMDFFLSFFLFYTLGLGEVKSHDSLYLFSEKEMLFSLLQFIAHCGNLFWAHQKVYNITQLSCLELWLLWCCLDSSRFCKQPGLA